jgi:hypothetical protein
MPNHFIEVARFFDSTDAHILRGLLEAEDIQVVIFDEYFSSLTPVDSVIAGGIKLLILDSDMDKAEPIIQKYYDNFKRDAGNVCPECDSLDVKKDYAAQFTMFCYAIFGALMGTGFKRHTSEYKKCNSCWYRW